MSIKIALDKAAPASSVELMITNQLPDYDLEDIEAAIPRDVDPMLASQGFKDLLDEARAILDRELAGGPLEIAQLTGAICHDKEIYRPGIWLVLRERGAKGEMSPAAGQRVAEIAETLRRDRAELPAQRNRILNFLRREASATMSPFNLRRAASIPQERAGSAIEREERRRSRR